MDYPEEAKSNIEKLINPETGEIDKGALSTIAFALVAIAEHLTAFGTGAAMRREIDKLAIKSDVQDERLGEIEKTLKGVATWCGAIEARLEIIEGVISGKEAE